MPKTDTTDQPPTTDAPKRSKDHRGSDDHRAPADRAHPHRSPTSDLSERHLVVGISGGIAVYKVCYIVSALVQRGATVTCVMTEAATRFVQPLTFEALSGRQVLVDLWRGDYAHDPQHIRLTQDADGVLLAPATANTLAKIACGLADDLLSTLMTAVTCPVLVAPAMNDAMWANKIVQANVARLKDLGFQFIGPAEGWQACRTVGTGRLAEPDEITAAAAGLLLARTRAT